jgi:response regulator RpfG family c-di-GMP phosphodiesterase
MRQHHERKDRTGFPNRAGGMQLHPMAEVLSLINEYLDHALNFESVEKEIYTHYSDRMVIAFKQLRFMISKSKTESKVESKIAA